MDKPNSDTQTGTPKNTNPERSIDSMATLKKVDPQATPESHGNKPQQKRDYAKYLMWPFIAVWRSIAKLIVFLNSYDGAVTAAATVVIGVLTYNYVGYSQKQWQVARDTLDVSQKSYLTIGTKEGVVGRFVSPKDSKQNAELILYFHNSGHIPAKLSWGTFGPNFIANPPGSHQQSSGILYTHPFKDMSRSIIKSGNAAASVAEQGDSTVIAGDSIFAAAFGEISQQDLATLQSNGIQPMMMGMFHYCDELGTDVRHQFAIGYRNAPSDELSWYIVFDKPMFFPRPTSTPDRIVLPPCETIAERQKNEETAKKLEIAKQPWWKRWWLRL